MKSSLAVGLLSLGLSAGALAANHAGAVDVVPPKVTPGILATPSGFKNACELGESMATSLRGAGPAWDKAQAAKTCGMLQPKMGDEDAASFLRCCVERLGGGAPAAKPEAPGT